MSTVVEQAFAALADAGARVEPGLTAAELSDVEARWGVRFCDDHAELLSLGVPVGTGWVDWRHDRGAVLEARLSRPVDGLLFDVEYNEFWPASWGARPADPTTAAEQARERLAAWPVLLPLYGHRYLPAAPFATAAPVLSVVQSDVIFYGSDLLEWVQREFLGVPLPAPSARPAVGQWSRLAEGCLDCDL